MRSTAKMQGRCCFELPDRDLDSGVIVVGFVLIAISKAGVLGPLENAVLTVISPVQNGLRNADRPGRGAG